MVSFSTKLTASLAAPTRNTAALATTHAPAILDTTDRLAELVHHLSGASLLDARRAIRNQRPAGPITDPLSLVAAAMVQLRNERPKAVA